MIASRYVTRSRRSVQHKGTFLLTIGSVHFNGRYTTSKGPQSTLHLLGRHEVVLRLTTRAKRLVLGGKANTTYAVLINHGLQNPTLSFHSRPHSLATSFGGQANLQRGSTRAFRSNEGFSRF